MENPLLDKIEQREMELTVELVGIFDSEIAKCFKWFGEKFPNRKYDLKFIGGMGAAFWALYKFNHVYTHEISEWYLSSEPESKHNDKLAIVLKPLFDFYNMIHEASDGVSYGNNCPIEFGDRDYLWYENEYLPKMKKDVDNLL